MHVRAPRPRHNSAIISAGPQPVDRGIMTIHQSVLELIGNTPIVKAQRLDTGACELFLKLESANPGGSIKDRIGLSMIEAAERAARSSPAPRWSRPPPAIPAWAWRWWRSRRATADPGRAGQDEPGEDLQPEGDGRRGCADPFRRGQGPSGVLPGHGRAHRRGNARRVLHQPVRQPGQSARARSEPPGRKSWSRWTAGSMPSCSAAARPAR